MPHVVECEITSLDCDPYTWPMNEPLKYKTIKYRGEVFGAIMMVPGNQWSSNECPEPYFVVWDNDKKEFVYLPIAKCTPV